MYLPDGFTEEEVLAAINKVVNTLAPLFKFGYYGLDDIRQEGSLEAIKALSKFSPTYTNRPISLTSKLEAFLFSHVRNRLINLRRDKLGRNSPPCCGCPAHKNSVCRAFSKDEISDCPKIIKWRARNEVKKNLVENYESIDASDNLSSSDSVLRSEFIAIIDKHLHVSLRGDYRRLIEGNKLSKRRKQKLMDAIKEILGDIYYG
jgi:hypothetical protein